MTIEALNELQKRAVTPEVSDSKKETEEQILWVKLQDITPEIFRTITKIYFSLFDTDFSPRFQELAELSQKEGKKGYLDWNPDGDSLEVRRLYDEKGLYLRFKARENRSAGEDEETYFQPTQKELSFQKKLDKYLIRKNIAVTLSQIYSSIRRQNLFLQ